MREIKFRAWQKTHKYWVHEEFGDLMWQDGNFYFDGDIKCDDTFAIMQYTGLKDKNGVEIYEGDIVRGYDFWGNKKTDPQEKRTYPYVAEVKYGDYGDTACHNSYGFYFDAKQSEELLGWQTPTISNLDNCEIIGNIYENKELLND